MEVMSSKVGKDNAMLCLEYSDLWWCFSWTVWFPKRIMTVALSFSFFACWQHWPVNKSDALCWLKYGENVPVYCEKFRNLPEAVFLCKITIHSLPPSCCSCACCKYISLLKSIHDFHKETKQTSVDRQLHLFGKGFSSCSHPRVYR